jgi:hypothetical protein
MTSPDHTIRKVHLIFKTHLDVGFTDYAQQVVRAYRERFIPQAIQTAAALRQQGGPRRFVWTTGAWLIHDYLRTAAPADRARLEDAIRAGDIAWHGLPFTTHTELMDADLFRHGLSLSQRLDQRFGRRTIAAKMTDVPGHTRAIVPLMAEAGLEFLHIGVNPASTPPDVPEVFVWRDAESGRDLLVMYHRGSYGDVKIVPGLDEALAFAHTGDNLGPQTPADALRDVEALQARFPSAEIVGSTLDAFALALRRVRDQLPVVTEELGDTWIHGVGSDPLKIAHFLELQRLRREWLRSGAAQHAGEGFDAFSDLLLMVPEHTWGMDIKTHLEDFATYAQPAFTQARQSPNFQRVERSWDEQRQYLRDAVSALPDALRREAESRLKASAPQPPDRAGFVRIEDLSATLDTTHFRLRIDPATGRIDRLRHNATRQQWATGDASHEGDPGSYLGLFWFEVFSQDDYARFHRDYNINKRTTSDWSIPDFTKPGMEAPAHRRWEARLVSAAVRVASSQHDFLLDLDMPAEAVQDYGAPRTLTLLITCPAAAPELHFDLRWTGKPASRLAQAAWFSFVPRLSSSTGWRLQKLGRLIDPRQVVRNGNRHLHAVEVVHLTERLRLETLDAPLVAPGTPSLLRFDNRLPALRDGVHVNLYNNVWGTNFRMWYEDDSRFRFRLAYR